MPEKMKAVVKLIENVGLVVLGITNAIGGAYLWSSLPFLSVSLFILSLICIVRGVSELWEIAFTKR